MFKEQRPKACDGRGWNTGSVVCRASRTASPWTAPDGWSRTACPWHSEAAHVLRVGVGVSGSNEATSTMTHGQRQLIQYVEPGGGRPLAVCREWNDAFAAARGWPMLKNEAAWAPKD
jgi:hypothetical protein